MRSVVVIFASSSKAGCCEHLTLVSINPQKHEHAIAFWKDDVLEYATIVGPDHPIHDTYKLGRVVIELPESYPIAFQKGDQNHLIAVAFSGGCIAGGFKDIETVATQSLEKTNRKTKDARRGSVHHRSSRRKKTERA